MEAYCVKCRAKREVRNPKKITLKNGRPSLPNFSFEEVRTRRHRLWNGAILCLEKKQKLVVVTYRICENT
jgi:hypothetical protein